MQVLQGGWVGTIPQVLLSIGFSYSLCLRVAGYEVGPLKDARDLAFLPQVAHAIERRLSEK